MFSLPIFDFASSQVFYQLHNSPAKVSDSSCFLIIHCIFLSINLTVIAAVNSSRVNCSFKFEMSSEYICLKNVPFQIESLSKSCLALVSKSCLISSCKSCLAPFQIESLSKSLLDREFKQELLARAV